ncbi:hypothetical protein [Candidatus Palauibacter sp.]|uniref:hypothetical protein n=1 Tax=Candidatus Palauibacter sp. TaxID=3101350 RepID=UPI003CC50CAF
MSGGRPSVATSEALKTIGGRIPMPWLIAWGAAVAIGAVGFVTTVGGDAQRAWMSVWSNFLFWTAISMAGIVFGAVLQVAKGHWGKSFRRLAEAAGAFLPVSFALFFTLRLGAEHIFPWLGPVETEHLNRDWLTLDGVFLRNGVLITLLYAFGFLWLFYSIRADAPLVAGEHRGWRRTVVSLLARRWRGDEEEVTRCRNRIGRLSAALILSWAIIFSLLSFDFGMSLTPGFVSIIWGPYYFIGGWLGMLALVAIMAHHYNGRFDGLPLWGKWDFHDLGKLTFAFVAFWTYLWFSQYLVIWYGNIPRETNFFMPRSTGGFGFMFWLQMVLIFALPFPFLLGRSPKMSSRWLAFVGSLILIGFWVERWNMVAPSIWHGEGLPLGPPEAMISVGFLGLFALAYGAYSTTFPKVPLRETIAEGSPGRGP